MAATTVRSRPSPEVVIHMTIFLAVFVRVFSSVNEMHKDPIYLTKLYALQHIYDKRHLALSLLHFFWYFHFVLCCMDGGLMHTVIVKLIFKDNAILLLVMNT